MLQDKTTIEELLEINDFLGLGDNGKLTISKMISYPGNKVDDIEDVNISIDLKKIEDLINKETFTGKEVREIVLMQKDKDIQESLLSIFFKISEKSLRDLVKKNEMISDVSIIPILYAIDDISNKYDEPLIDFGNIVEIEELEEEIKVEGETLSKKNKVELEEDFYL